MLASLSAFVLLKQSSYDWYKFGPYASGVPRPDVTLGYGPGDRHTTFREQEKALFAIAEKAKAKVKVIEFGRSVEGRPLRLYAVSTAENIKRLEQIRLANLQAANGQPVPADLPALVWVNEGIHGNETASFESAMPLLYNLAASSKIEKDLANVVVLLNPTYNPDGHERYVVYYNSISVGGANRDAFEAIEPRTIHGRTNHYRFDMNRDRVAMSQDESRAEVAEFLKWRPQVYIDQHGQVENYFFPPNQRAVNDNTDRNRVEQWTQVFGRACAATFDAAGWTYFIRDTFDLFYSGYLDSFTTLSGAIGMTHETDGGRLVKTTRDDGTILTLRDGASRHFASAISVIKAAAANRQALRASFAKFQSDTVTGKFSPEVKGYAMTGDLRALRRVKAQLGYAGIESSLVEGLTSTKARAFGSKDAKAVTLKGATLMVSLLQSQGRLAKSVLEPQPQFEPEFVASVLKAHKPRPAGDFEENDEDSFYDLAGWSIPYAHNLEAYELLSLPSSTRPYADPEFKFDVARGTVGYAWIYQDDDDALGVIDLLNQGVNGMVTNRTMKIDGKEYPRGTFIFLRARNGAGYADKVRETAKRYGAKVELLGTSYPDSGRQGPGSESVSALNAPKIGVVFGNNERLADVGAIWYLMDRVWKLPYTPLRADNIRQSTLSKLTAILVPSDVTVSSDAVKTWVREGGTIISLGDGGTLSAFNAGAGSGTGDGIPGGIFRAQLNPNSSLSYGYAWDGKGTIPVSVPVGGFQFFGSNSNSVVKFAEGSETKLLSGWAWPDETEKALAGTAWLQESRLGAGRVVGFLYDPTDRAMWPGTYRMILNAILMR
jgi:hypothetical protein